MIRAAIYARVSTDAQDRSESILTQIQFGERWAPARGYEVVGIYQDSGWSGTIPVEQRPDGARLLRDARAGLFDVVLVYQVDRLGRDPVVVLNAVQALAAVDVRIQSMQEAFDERDPMGRFLLSLFSSIGRLVRDQTVARGIEGSRRLVREGGWPGGAAPYGYRADGVGKKARLVPNEEPIPQCPSISEAEVVRRIYRWYAADGWSTGDIARQLSALGLKLRSGYEPSLHRKTGKPVWGHWYAQAVAKLTARPVYKGEYVYGSRRAEGPVIATVPALVSVELWNAARERARENHQLARRNAQRSYLLRGLLYCGRCDCSYSGHSRGLYIYYQCNSSNHGAQRRQGSPEASGACGVRVVHCADVEERAWSEVEQVIEDPELLVELYQIQSRREQLTPAADPGLDLEAVRLALAGKDTERERVGQAFAVGAFSLDDLQRQMERIKGETDALLRREAELRGALESERQRFRGVRLLQEYAASVRHLLRSGLTDEGRQPIIRNMLTRVVLHQHEAGFDLDFSWRFTLRSFR